MRLGTLCAVLCLLFGLHGAVAVAQPYTLSVKKVVEWNGVEADPAQAFVVCVMGPEPSEDQTCSEPLGDSDTWIFLNLGAGTYKISELNLGNEWDFLVGRPGDDPVSPDEVFVDDRVTVSRDTEIVVRNSRLLNYAFVAIGNQILRIDLANLIGTGDPVLPDPENPSAPYDTIVLYEAANTIFNGVTLAGDGDLYFCGNDGIKGFVQRLLDPLEPLPTQDPELVFDDPVGVFDPRCGSVDPYGALVVANGQGGVLKFFQTPDPVPPFDAVEGGGLAGICVFRDTTPFPPVAEAGLCWPELPEGGFPGALEDLTIDGSDDPAVGFPSDVAYLYDNDLLVRTEVALGGGNGPPGQQKKQPATDGALLRVFWPDFDPLFFGDGFFSDDPALCNNQNFKYLLSGLELEGNVTVSGNQIFVTDGKNLERVVPPTGTVDPCQIPVATTETYASVSGNKRIQVAAGDLDGKVYFGTRSSNSAGLYLADGLSAEQVKEFPKNTYAAAIDGLAVTPTPREEDLPAVALDRWETELDALRFFLSASCGLGATVTEVPTLVTVAQALIDDIPDATDPNDPDANQNNVAVPNPPPGLDGWQALIETQGCDLTTEGLILTEFWYSILLNNRRVSRHDSVCTIDSGTCFSSFETLLANSLFDPRVIFDDPIRSGGTRRSRRQVVGAALDPARRAVFFGYLSPLFNSLDPFGDVYTLTPSTNVPIKFKLETFDGEPLIGALASLTIARIANVPPSNPSYPGNPEDPECPFPEFMKLEPNGAGLLGPLGQPLYEGNQGNGNYGFNQFFVCEGFDPGTADDWCDGDYRITTTFLSDNLEEQETLIRVSGCPPPLP